MIVHHHPFLAPSRFARLALAEHKVDASYIREPFWEAREEFVSVNPALILPMASEDGAAALCGAEVLMEYLDERYGEALAPHRLMPSGWFERAEVRRLVAWFMRKFEDEVAGPLVTERILKIEMPSNAGGGAPNSVALRNARHNVSAHFGYLGALLDERDFLAGRTVTFADLAAAASLSVVDYLGDVPWDSEPMVKAWYQKLKSRPSFRSLLADRARMVPPAPHYGELDF